MRLFYGAVMAALILAVLWAKLAPNQAEVKPDAEKPQEIVPAQPPVAETPSPFTDDYKKAMEQTEKKVVLIFACEKCPSCELLKKNLKEFNFEGFLVCTIDASKQKELVKEYKVRRLPTSVMIEKGKETDRLRGFSKARYEAWLSEHK